MTNKEEAHIKEIIQLTVHDTKNSILLQFIEKIDNFEDKLESKIKDILQQAEAVHKGLEESAKQYTDQEVKIVTNSVWWIKWAYGIAIASLFAVIVWGADHFIEKMDSMSVTVNKNKADIQIVQSND